MRRRRKPVREITVILISSLLGLIFVGISYANWNDGMHIKATVFTGEMKLAFDKDVQVNVEKEGSQSKLYGEMNLDKLEDQNLEVTGEVYGDNKGAIEFKVLNKSTIPAVFDREETVIKKGDKKVNSRSKVSLELEKNLGTIHVEDRNGNKAEAGKLILNLNGAEEGTYTFTTELFFKQWNK